MSETPTRFDERLLRYVAERTRGEDPFLRDLREAARKAGIPSISIGPEQASFMQVLLKASGAREVVEVGTLFGLSAIAMARALPEGGRVRTVEVDHVHAAFARKWIAKSDVADRIEVHVGPGGDVLPRFADGSADACFLDADKGGYAGYLAQCRRILRPGGLVMADNAFAFGQLLDEAPTDADVPAVRAFNDHMAAQRWLHGIIVPFGDGLWVAVKE